MNIAILLFPNWIFFTPRRAGSRLIKPCAGGIGASLFLAFLGLYAIHMARHEHIQLATPGNPGPRLATWAGGLPGVASVTTHCMTYEMDQFDIPRSSSSSR
jgi:hypothetical protein